MIFELSPDQQAAHERARTFAHDRLAAVAASIDESGVVPADVQRELQSVVPGKADATTLVVTVEALAGASAAAAAVAASGSKTAAPADAPGLRGFAAPAAPDTRGRLVFAAIALGIGRAAVETALGILRDSARSEHDQEKPHWVVADAATEVEAARVTTLRAAQAFDDQRDAEGFVAMAKLAAVRAAQQAVDAALRVAGADGFKRGTLLERLTRDARAVSLMMGTEEELRAAVAQAVLPG
jgi:alkylation response protein AidB-like acyl-CoA dehydrogenase